jgi:hypothetical protein
MTQPSLHEQAAAVERAAVNLRGHVDNLRLLVTNKKRPAVELQMAAYWLPALEAAAITLRRYADSSRNDDFKWT